jgi:hypothetical protein
MIITALDRCGDLSIFLIRAGNGDSEIIASYAIALAIWRPEMEGVQRNDLHAAGLHRWKHLHCRHFG